MTNEKVKRMLDACYQAKRIRELLPPLPQGVMPSYIQYMDTIQKLEKQGIQVKVSDISSVMNLPRPGVTRTVKEMETKGYLHKFASKEDGRVTYISITDEGRKLSQKYDRDYFSELALSLSDISEEDADCMIQTIEKFYQIMCERRKEYDCTYFLRSFFTKITGDQNSNAHCKLNYHKSYQVQYLTSGGNCGKS